MADTRTSGPGARAPHVLMGVAVAVVVGTGIALWPYVSWNRAPDSSPPPGSVSPDPDIATGAADSEADTTADIAGEGTPTAVEASLAVADAGDTAILRVVADPPELRVWANTRVRLSVETTENFSNYIWHFEDGSEPVSGAVVEHVFAESVRDRHVTVEGVRPGAPKVVATRRLPVERLAVLSASGDDPPEERKLPKAEGTRLMLVGGTLDGALAGQIVAVAGEAEVAAIVVMGDPAGARLIAEALDGAGSQAARLALLLAPTVSELTAEADPPLRLMRGPEDVVTPVRKGDRDLGVLAVGDVALVAVDTRGHTLPETELRRLHDALLWTTAYRVSLVLTARPWTQTRDGEVIADRSYRLYEYALRQQVSAVISGDSGVFFDGRFGGLRVVGVGRAEPGACVRPLGDDACQPASITLLDANPGRGLATHVLTGASFDHVLARHAMPAEVGKIRR